MVACGVLVHCFISPIIVQGGGGMARSFERFEACEALWLGLWVSGGGLVKQVSDAALPSKDALLMWDVLGGAYPIGQVK